MQAHRKTLHAPFTAHKPVLVKKTTCGEDLYTADNVYSESSHDPAGKSGRCSRPPPHPAVGTLSSQHPENEKERNVFCVILIKVYRHNLKNTFYEIHFKADYIYVKNTKIQKYNYSPV